jgi:LmbE family N-acetylglucosaminyl deacetylase
VTHIVAISPHLDDAAFSVGGLLAAQARAGDRVTIVTCFTGNVPKPEGFALACQLDKGLGPEVDYMALRRAEDQVACAVIGAAAVHLPLLEAPHRGYASAPELFAARRDDDGMLAPLTDALA